MESVNQSSFETLISHYWEALHQHKHGNLQHLLADDLNVHIQPKNVYFNKSQLIETAIKVSGILIDVLKIKRSVVFEQTENGLKARVDFVQTLLINVNNKSQQIESKGYQIWNAKFENGKPVLIPLEISDFVTPL